MGTLKTAIAALLVLSACDGGNVTTTNNNNNEQHVNVNTDPSKDECKLLCVGVGDVVQVSEVCGGEVTSVHEVPLAMIPANCEPGSSDETGSDTVEPTDEPTPSASLAKPASGGSVVFG